MSLDFVEELLTSVLTMCSLAGSEVIEFVIPNATIPNRWFIHKSLLECHSTFLSQVNHDDSDSEGTISISSKSDATPTKVFNMKKVNPDVFSAFVAWLYTGKLEGSKDGFSAWFCFDCWVLGHDMGAVGFQNAIMRVFLKVLQSGIDFRVDLVKKAYDRTPLGSNLRKLMVDVRADCRGDDTGEPEDWDDLVRDYPAFLSDLMARFREEAPEEPLEDTESYMV